MSDLSERVAAAFRDHGAFERVDGATYALVSTPFEGRVRVEPAADPVRFEVTVEVPMLDAVVEGDVAPVVEDGWYETFELRVVDVGAVTRRDRDLDPSVRRSGETAVVTIHFEDEDPRRGVEDAHALLNYVEGTYVQGVIPGYDYRDPVADLLERAQSATEQGVD